MDGKQAVDYEKFIGKLRFPEEMERDYVRNYLLISFRHTRMVVLAASFLFLAAHVIDYFVLPDATKPALIIRAGYFLILIGFTFFTYGEGFRRNFEWLVAFTGYLGVVTQILLPLFSTAEHRDIYGMGVLILMVATMLLGRIRFYYSAAFLWTSFITYLAASLMVGYGSLDIFVFNFVVLLCYVIIATVSTFYYDQQMRHDYLVTKELKEKREEAESATRLKDKFVSLIAHDLKGPISNVMGYLGLALDDRNEELGEGPRLIVSSAVENCRSMVKIIDELLDISRLQTGSIIPKKRFIDAWNITYRAVSNFEYNAGEKGLDLESRVTRGKNFLHTDQTLFLQVVENLVSNAIKFCRKGDTITVFIPEGRPSAIAVRDTGLGIEPERIESLFRSDVKSSTIGTEGETGTGLGLPFSKEIMKALGGDLRVESVPGEGSTFFAELPTVNPAVLIVDDEPMQIKLMSAYLRKLPIKADLIQANDGREAMEILRDRRVDLVITDLFMPVMDGFQLLDEMKRDPDLKATPAIAVTSNAGMGEKAEEVVRLSSDFIIRPVNEPDFLLRVEKILLG